MSARTTAVLSHGFILTEGGDACVYAARGDVRSGVDRGDGQHGTLVLPSPLDVRKGKTYGAGATELGGLLEVVPCPPPPRQEPPPRVYPAPPLAAPMRVPAAVPCAPCGGTITFKVTRGYTSNCAGPKVGSKTVSVESCSSVSEAHAAQLALALAKQQAEAELVCQFQATATGTGVCGHVETRTGTSSVSQDDAYQQALAAATDAANVWCVANTATYSSTRSATANATCPDGSCGEAVSVTIDRTAYSTVSQSAANTAAQALADADAPAAAQAALDCSATVYYSTREVTVYCADGTTGSPSTFSATRSACTQDAADTAAQNAAQAGADAGLDCTPITYTSHVEVTVGCPDGTTGGPVMASGDGTSDVSQADADAQATSAANAAAAVLLETACTPVVYTANAQATVDCPGGGQQTGYGFGISTTSQNDADNAAMADAQANALAQCPPEE